MSEMPRGHGSHRSGDEAPEARDGTGEGVEVKGCLFDAWEVSEPDLAELEKLERFLYLVKDGKTQVEAYAEVYGEVVFDASAAGRAVRR
jgi:hypothetical protein